MKITAKYFLFILIILFWHLILLGQQSKIDSLKKILLTDKEDTSKINHLNALGWELRHTNPDTAILLANKALVILNQVKNLIEEQKQKFLSNTFVNLGYYNYLKNDYLNALDYYLKAVKIDEALKNKSEMIKYFRDIGVIYKVQGNHPKSLEYYLKGLRIAEEVGDKNGIAKYLGNIGTVYWFQSDYSKALEYYLKALKITEALGNKIGIARGLGNIGDVYLVQGEAHPNPSQRDGLFNKALEYYLKGLRIAEEVGDKYNIANIFGNIGNLYYEQKDFSLSLDYYFKALKINEEVGDKRSESVILNHIGSLYAKTGKFYEAEAYLKKAIVLSDSIGAKAELMDGRIYISQLYDTIAQLAIDNGQLAKAAEKYKLSLIHYKKAVMLKDTLFNEEKAKDMTRKEMNYEFDKKESLAKTEQEKKDAIANEEKRQQKIIIYSVSGGLLLVLLLALFIFRGYKQKQKANKELAEKNSVIAEQKKLVEEKNKDITDSINYAQRIQRALLASDNLLVPALKGEFAQDYFILFKPKDIVSGDFYWACKVLPNGEDLGGARFYLAICDSTGHGVPGAFMSLLNISFLNEAINGEELIHPNEIFNHVRQRLIENISAEGAKDGMDGILLKFQVSNSKSQVPEYPFVIIEYAASNNAPVLINSSLQELDCDNMPVGISDKKNSFTLNAVPLPNGKGLGDGLGVLYLFTDGFADQFGGLKDKKFKTKQLKQKLMEINHLPMKEQKEVLEQTFNDWKGTREQTDDVLIVGIKI